MNCLFNSSTPDQWQQFQSLSKFTKWALICRCSAILYCTLTKSAPDPLCSIIFMETTVVTSLLIQLISKGSEWIRLVFAHPFPWNTLTWRSIGIGIQWTKAQKMKVSVFLIWCTCQLRSYKRQSHLDFNELCNFNSISECVGYVIRDQRVGTIQPFSSLILYHAMPLSMYISPGPC